MVDESERSLAAGERGRYTDRPNRTTAPISQLSKTTGNWDDELTRSPLPSLPHSPTQQNHQKQRDQFVNLGLSAEQIAAALGLSVADVGD